MPPPTLRPAPITLPARARRAALDVAVAAGRLKSGRAATADGAFATDPQTLVALLDDPDGLDAALSDGRVSGEPAAARRLLRALGAARDPARA